MASETATLGGGCFWCVEAVFDEAIGVISVESGYMGGQTRNPTYKEVCSGHSGHVEVVQVTFDPGVISFRELLEIFFTVHDPTTRDRQGNDVGTQYRSVVFYHSEEQKKTTEEVIRELSAEQIWPHPFVTAIEAATEFYIAEDYHQEYFRTNPSQPYCRVIVEPKVRKFREKFREKLRA